MEQAEGSGKVSTLAHSRPPVVPKKTDAGVKTAKVSGSGGVRPPSAGLSAWEDAAGPHDCDLLAYLGKAEDAAAPGGVRSGSSPGNRTLSQTGDGNLTQALLAARVAAEAERSAAQLEQRQELSRRASQASRAGSGSGSASGASDRTGGSGKPPRAPEQTSSPAAVAAGPAGSREAADPRLQGMLLSDEEDDDDDLVDLMEADDDVLFAGCGDGDRERSRASGTGGGKRAAAAPAALTGTVAQAESAEGAGAAGSAAPAGRGAGGSGSGASSGSGVLAGGSRGSSAESAGALAAPGGRKRVQGSGNSRGGAVAQAGHGAGVVAPQAAQPLYGQPSQALLSYQQQYYSQLQQQQQYAQHGGQAAPSIPVVQVGEGLRQLQMQPRRAFTPGHTSRSPVRGSGYVVATASNARVLTPPGSPTSRGGPSGAQPVLSGNVEPGSVYSGANSAPQSFLSRAPSPPSAEADGRAHTPHGQGQQQHPGGQHPHISGTSNSPSGSHDHTAPHVVDGGGPEATAALLAAFAPTTSPHRHGGGFNMSSWGSPHHGGWAAGGGGGGGGGGAGRFSSTSAGYTAGLVYRSMPISQVPGSAAEDGAAAGGSGLVARSSISPGRLSGRAPTLGLMRDRHGSANASGPLAAAAAAAVAAAGSRTATSPHAMRPATSPSRARSFASVGSAVAGPLEPGYARAYAAPSRQSLKRAAHGTPPAPLVMSGVVMSAPAAEGADGVAAGPGGEPGAGVAGGMLRGPMVPAMPQYHHAPPPIRHCGFGPRAGGHGSLAAAFSASSSPPTLAMSGAAGTGGTGAVNVAPSVFLGSRAKATDERMRLALLAKVLAGGAGGGGKDPSPPPQHHLLMLAHQQQQHQVAIQHGHGGPGHQQQHHTSPGGVAAEGHAAPLAANGFAPAALAGAGSAGPIHRQGPLPHLPNSGAGEQGHPGGFVPHAALPAGPTLAGRIGGGLVPGHGQGQGQRVAATHAHHHGSSARSYSFDSPRNGAVSHA